MTYPRLDGMRQDLRFAVRTLRRAPVFTTVALVTLALGIGVNTAVFSAVNGILLSPLPFPEPGRLVAIWPGHFASAAELDYLQHHARSYDGGAAAFSPGWGAALTLPDHAVQLSGAHTSANFFRVLGARPILGRTFVDGESAPGRTNVVVLSHAVWRAQFGGDSSIVGRTVLLDGSPTTVVGVMPAGFSILQHDADFWMPWEVDPASPFYTGGIALLLGRLNTGTSARAARAEFASFVPDIRRAFAYADRYGSDVDVISLRDSIVGSMRPMLLILLGAVGFIVLIAGANVGNLLLARAGGRRQEMALRSAIGASRVRIVRQMLVESVVLALGGGVLGLALGYGGVRVLRALLPASVPRLDTIAINPIVLATCAAVTLGVGLVFGLAPALLGSRQDLQAALREGGARERGVFGRGVRGMLVVAEVALAVVLVTGAGLMLQSMWRLSLVDPGFNADNVLTLRLQPSGPEFSGGVARARYFGQVLDSVRAVPGVLSAGAIQHLPLTGFDWHRPVEIEGRPLAPGATPFTPGWRTVAGDYFRTMGIRLLDGRAFEPRDDAGAPLVALVNATFAESRFPGESALGQRIRIGTGTAAPTATIVGVVSDVHHVSLTEAPEAEFFVSEVQMPQWSMAVVARTTGDPMALARTIVSRLTAMAPGVPISGIQPLSRLAWSSVAERRVVMLLLSLFAAVGLVLGAIGIYGVVNYAVSARVREIGIRIALGAGRMRVTSLVLRQGVAYAMAGVALGLAVAFAVATAARSLVYEVSPTDPWTYAAVSVTLLVTATLASWLPARRAARIDPVRAIRQV